MSRESVSGWYPCAIYMAFSTMAEAQDLDEKHDSWPDEWVKDFEKLLSDLSKHARGCVVKQADEYLMMVEKLPSGGVLGMRTLLDCRADSPNEAYRKAEEQELHIEGPLVIRYMDFDKPRQPPKMH